MFHQLLTPVANSLVLSCLVAMLPVLMVLLLLGILRRPAWQAALAGLIVAFIVAVVPWQMPLNLAMHSMLNGAIFALWPVMWIVVNGLLLYNTVSYTHLDVYKRQAAHSSAPVKRGNIPVSRGFMSALASSLRMGLPHWSKTTIICSACSTPVVAL